MLKSLLTSVSIIFTVLLMCFTLSILPVDAQAQNNGQQNRSQEAKMNACQAREAGLNKRMQQLTTFSLNMMQKFDMIAMRVEEYYTTKVASRGKTVANYDDLVLDIQTKKSNVQQTITMAQDNAEEFSCQSSDPKSQLSLFRADMQGVKMALKEYRTSIKNLIVAVHSVTGATNNNNNSGRNNY